MPITVMSVVGQRQAHPAVALGLDDHDRAGLGDREVRAGDRPRGRAGTSRAGGAGRPRRAPAGSSVRSSGAGRPARRHLAPEDLPDLGPVAVDRRDEDVRRQVVARAGRSARRGRSPRRRCPHCASASFSSISWVDHRLDLDDLAAPPAVRTMPSDDRVRLGGVAGPVDDAAGGRHVPLQLVEQLGQAGEDVVLDRGAGEAELLPVLDARRRPGPACRGSSSSPGRGSPGAGRRRARPSRPSGTAACRRRSVRAGCGGGRGRRGLAESVTRRPRRPGSRRGA